MVSLLRVGTGVALGLGYGVLIHAAVVYDLNSLFYEPSLTILLAKATGIWAGFELFPPLGYLLSGAIGGGVDIIFQTVFRH